MQKPRFLVGQTATGKKEIVLNMFDITTNFEVISLDAYKVYRGMDIGTAKPPKSTLRRIPHHLVDIIDPPTPYSAGNFVQDSSKAVAEISGRGRVPIFAGGTFMYYKSFVYGILDGADTDPDVRQEIQDTVMSRGNEYAHDYLKRLDPEAAEKIHINDAKRISRALEIIKMTGRKVSELQTQWYSNTIPDVLTVAIVREEADLRHRIDLRTRTMFYGGIIDECKRLSASGGFGDFKNDLAQTMGYFEALEVIRGRVTVEQAIDQTNARTYQFTRKQLKWIRSLPEVKIVSISPDQKIAEVAKTIAKIFRL